MPKQHRRCVQCIVFGRDDVWSTLSIPIERGVQDRFHKVAIGKVIGPLSLPLKTGRQRLVSYRLLAQSHLRELWIADHQISSDQRHLYTVRPLAVDLLTRTLGLRAVVVVTLGAILFDPRHRFVVLVLIELIFVHPSDELGHVDIFDPHPQPFFPKAEIDHRTCDSHRGPAHRQVSLATHQCGRQSTLGKV